MQQVTKRRRRRKSGKRVQGESIGQEGRNKALFRDDINVSMENSEVSMD